jgi:hypothetical protein
MAEAVSRQPLAAEYHRTLPINVGLGLDKVTLEHKSSRNPSKHNTILFIIENYMFRPI